MFGDKIIYCKNPKETMLRYIKEWFKLILPFQVNKGYHFQIRIKKERFEKLNKKTRTVLRMDSSLSSIGSHNGTNVYDEGSEELRLWREENYWSNCKAYIFNFEAKYAYCLETRCKYRQDGLEDCFEIVFFDIEEYPSIIYNNIDANENKDNFRERMEKKGGRINGYNN